MTVLRSPLRLDLRITAILHAMIIILMTSHLHGLSMTKAECDSLIVEAVKIRESNENLEKSFKTLQDVLRVAKSKGWHKQEFLALNNIGAAYLSSHSYGEAIDFFNQAYVIAVEHLKSSETKTALNNIAILYSKDNNLPKAIEIFRKAYDIAVREKDSLQIGLYALNLGQAYIKNGQFKEADTFLDESGKYVTGNDYMSKLRMNLLADLAFSKGNYEESRRRSLELLNLNDIENPKYSEILHEVYFIIARSSLNLGDHESAARYAALSIQGKAGLEQKIQGYEFLSRLEYSMGNYNKAFTFKDSVIILHDSLYSIQNNRLLKISKAKFELQEYQYELSLKENQLYSLKLIMIIAAIVLIILGILAWWGIHNNIQRLRQRRENEENKRIMTERLLREKETESQLEQERLKSQIEQRNRELAAKALYLSGRNRLIEEIITFFNDKVSLSASQRAKLDELRGNFDSEKEWNEFAELFEQINNGPLLKLKQRHADLNAADLRFVIYIYMNLSNKEIASMLNITLDACRKRKERISKKLGLESANELYDYLFSL